MAVSNDVSTPAGTLRAWAASVPPADIDAMADLLADGFTYVHSSSNLETKDQLLTAFKNGRRYRSWEIRGEVNEARYPGCAVLTGIADLGVTRDGEPAMLNLRFTATLVENGGRWLLAAFQTTRLPE